MDGILKASPDKPESVRPMACQACENTIKIAKRIGIYNKDLGTMDEETSGEAKMNKGLLCGVKPSKKEVDDHERTHLPFRSWCKHCVFGKAQSHPHYRKDKETLGVPTISWDHMYMKADGSKYEGKDIKDEMPIVVWKDSSSKAIGAFVVPNTGGGASMQRGGLHKMLTKYWDTPKCASKEQRRPRTRAQENDGHDKNVPWNIMRT